MHAPFPFWLWFWECHGPIVQNENWKSDHTGISKECKIVPNLNTVYGHVGKHNKSLVHCNANTRLPKGVKFEPEDRIYTLWQEVLYAWTFDFFIKSIFFVFILSTFLVINP